MSDGPPMTDDETARGTTPLRVTGVVELADDDEPQRPSIALRAARRRENERVGRRLWSWSLVLAGFALTLPFAWLAAEIAGYLAVRGSLEGWRPNPPVSGVPLTVLLAGLILFAGYAGRQFFRAVDFAAEIAEAAERLTRAPRPAVDPSSSRAVAAMNDEVADLNRNIDGALTRLAEVESMIRRQVGAIDEASQALSGGASEATDKIASERDRLMQLTETMNAQADAFAAAIADKARMAAEAAKLSDADIASAETDMGSRIKRLEEVAGTALRSFKALTDALGDQSSRLEQSTDAAERAAKAAVERLDAQNARVSEARRKLTDENERLQTLIDEQRTRAERLADEITAHVSEPAPEPEKPAPPPIVDPDEKTDFSGMLTPDETKPLPLTEPLDEEPKRKKPSASDRPSDAMRAALRKDLEQIGSQRPQRRRPAEPRIPERPTRSPVLPSGTSDRLDELARELADRRRDAARANIEEADADTPPKDKSWREILAAVDDPAKPAKKPEAAGDSARRKRRALERATYEMDKILNGAPSRDAIKRYEGGQRDVFAVRLLSEGDAELKTRAKEFAEADQKFALVVRRYLEDFDSLLELAAGREEAEQALEAFLNSAFGRVYMLLGSGVGYFA